MPKSSIPVPVKKDLPLSLDLQLQSKHSDKMSASFDPKIIENNTIFFQGQGKLANDQVKLNINDKVLPVVQPQCRLPYRMRRQVSAELQKVVEQDIIE